MSNNRRSQPHPQVPSTWRYGEANKQRLRRRRAKSSDIRVNVDEVPKGDLLLQDGDRFTIAGFPGIYRAVRTK